MLRFIIHVSKGLIREQRTRRSVMFFAMLGALIWLFLGATFFDAWLRARPLLFLIYWAACGWVTLLAFLLAVFDVLMIRAATHRERRRLAAEFLKKEESSRDDAS